MSRKNFLDLRIAQHKALLWIIAIIITIASAIYQRLTGPTYPLRGKVEIENTTVSFKLPRSATTDKDAAISIYIPNPKITGYIRYRRYKSLDTWMVLPLKRQNEKLAAFLPKQPAAGKLMYYVYLKKGKRSVSLSGNEPVIIRFKGNVPAWILIPHVVMMFLAMLYSNRSALEALDSQGNSKKYMQWTIILFFIGGLILGPIVQKFAFGAFWTGVPYGYDLTDNKTLLAALGWIWAWINNRKGRDGRLWILFAAILMLMIYLIPHSVLGSELDYTKLPTNQ